MSLTLAEALERVPFWANQPTETTILAGGITNKNYRVDVGGESYVIRIGGEKSEHLGIDREIEYQATEAAAALGIAPEVVYFIRPEGYLVTRFVSGRLLPPEEMRRTETIHRVAMMVRRVHGLAAVPAGFSAFRTVERYAATASQFGVALPSRFEIWLGSLHQIEVALAVHSPNPVLCHNDLLNANFLDDGAIRLLDWEYAGMGDAAFDLANFAVHHDFTDEQEEHLLNSYCGAVLPATWARLKLMKIVSDFREAMWGMVQVGISELDFDFQGYAERHFRRMAGNLADPRLSIWLNVVGQE